MIKKCRAQIKNFGAARKVVVRNQCTMPSSFDIQGIRFPHAAEWFRSASSMIVQWGWGPRCIAHTFHRKESSDTRFPFRTSIQIEMFEDRIVGIGTYGVGTADCGDVWDALVKDVMATV